MVYISEPTLLVTTPPEGTWPVLFFFSSLYREEDCQSAWGNTTPSIYKPHAPTQSAPLSRPPTRTAAPQCSSVRQTVVRGCTSTLQKVTSHLEEESYLFPLNLLIYEAPCLMSYNCPLLCNPGLPQNTHVVRNPDIFELNWETCTHQYRVNINNLKFNSETESSSRKLNLIFTDRKSASSSSSSSSQGCFYR